MERSHPACQTTPTLYRGRGCEGMQSKRLSRRVPIHELMVVSDRMKALIQTRTRTGELLALAKREGMKTLLQDGIEKKKSCRDSRPISRFERLPSNSPFPSCATTRCFPFKVVPFQESSRCNPTTLNWATGCLGKPCRSTCTFSPDGLVSTRVTSISGQSPRTRSQTSRQNCHLLDLGALELYARV